MTCGSEIIFSKGHRYMDEKRGFGKLIVFFILMLSVAVLNMGCQDQRSSTKVSKGVREPVTLGIASETLSAPFIIAQEKGYFADEGLDVTIKEYAFGKLALEAMFAGEVKLATVAETPIVMNSFKRDDFSVIALFVYNYDDTKMVVRKDRGINKALDLKGKKVGSTFGTSTQFFLDSYLNYYGFDSSDVKTVNISQKDMPAALRSGEVDAVAVFEPYGHEALELLQDKAMRLPKTEIFRETFNLVAMKDFQKDHPEALKKILRAIDRAITFIKQNKGESIAVLVKKLRMDEKYLYDSWDDYVFGLSLDQTLLINFEDVARWAIKNRLTDKTQVPNYLNYLYLDGLGAVKPEAVRVIK